VREVGLERAVARLLWERVLWTRKVRWCEQQLALLTAGGEGWRVEDWEGLK
jgi:hypothetical protein